MALRVALLASIPAVATCISVASVFAAAAGYPLALLAALIASLASALALSKLSSILARAAASCAREASTAHAYGLIVHTQAIAKQLGSLWPLLPSTLGLAGLPIAIVVYYTALRLALARRAVGGTISLALYTAALVATLGAAALILAPLTARAYGAAVGCEVQDKARSYSGCSSSLHVPDNKS